MYWLSNYSNIYLYNYKRDQSENNVNTENNYKISLEYFKYLLYYRKMKTIKEYFNLNILELDVSK